MSGQNKASPFFKTIDIRSIIWFLPLPQFLVGFVAYYLVSTAWLFGAQDVPIFKAALTVFVVGILMTGAFSATARLIQREDARAVSRERDKDSKSGGSPGPSISNDGLDQKELREKKRLELLRREAIKQHDVILRSGAKIAVGCVIYWFIMRTAFGLSPQEVFILPWYLVAVLWFFALAFLGRWFSYAGFLTTAGVRFAYQVFGPTILMLLPNFLMLPIFYLLMMFFMFGSIMIPNLLQQKYYKPGDATWETPKGSMVGQPEARAQIDTQMRRFYRYAEATPEEREQMQKPSRGMIFEGPPGTGKTLVAKELGTEAGLPFVFSDGSSFNAPFMGFAALLVLVMRFRTEALCKEYGGAFVFIDEGEMLLQSRGGMQPEMMNQDSLTDIWDVFSYDAFGCTSSCGLAYDTHGAREQFWQKKFVKEYRSPVFMMPGAGGGMGANAAIYPFLTWLNGADGPPLGEKIFRRKINQLLSSIFIPVQVRNYVLRLAPGKSRHYNIMFIAATNRAFMIDPAMRRPGRFGVSVKFVHPDLESRDEIVELYLKKGVRKGLVRPELLERERIVELAGVTQGMSPAEIEQLIEEAPDVRIEHVTNLERIKELIDGGASPEELAERDKKYWKRWKDYVGTEGWDDPRADWHSLMEARSSVVYGRSDPGKTSEAHRRTTAYHEFGHLLALKAFLDYAMKPTVLTIMPRRNALGMVAYVGLEDRDPRPQRFYEGMIRVSVASTVTERFFFGENQPGVSSDLENSTRIACLMAGKFGMAPYHCSSQEKKKYCEIGESLISVPASEMPSMGMPVANLLDKVLMNSKSRENVAIFLGRAFVDNYRLIRANKELFNPVVERLLEIDEFSGNELESLWSRLDDELQNLGQLDEAESAIWPESVVKLQSPFYQTQLQPEGGELVAQLSVDSEEVPE